MTTNDINAEEVRNEFNKIVMLSGLNDKFAQTTLDKVFQHIILHNEKIITNVRNLASLLDLSLETVTRLLDEISKINVLVHKKRGRGGYIIIDPAPFVTQLLENIQNKKQGASGSSSSNIYNYIKNNNYQLVGYVYELQNNKLVIKEDKIFKSFIGVITISELAKTYDINSNQFIDIIQLAIKHDRLIDLIAYCLKPLNNINNLEAFARSRITSGYSMMTDKTIINKVFMLANDILKLLSKQIDDLTINELRFVHSKFAGYISNSIDEMYRYIKDIIDSTETLYIFITTQVKQIIRINRSLSSG